MTRSDVKRMLNRNELLVGICNLPELNKCILGKLSPIDEKKDRSIRQLLSVLTCYYQTETIPDHQKIQLLNDLYRNNEDNHEAGTHRLFDAAIEAAYTNSSERSVYHEHFSREQLDGAVLSVAIDDYCKGNAEETQSSLINLLDSPLDGVRKLAVGNLAYMVRRDEAPSVTQSFEELVSMADGNNSTLHINILLYFAINKNGESSDLCRQTWHAFCQLLPAERESAAEWWQNSEVVGTEEHKIVAALLRYADADMDLLTMLKQIKEVSSAMSLVAPLS